MVGWWAVLLRRVKLKDNEIAPTYTHKPQDHFLARAERVPFPDLLLSKKLGLSKLRDPYQGP